MPRTVEFFYDFGSPAAYLAFSQLPHLCADVGAQLVWRPMLLGGVFQATGNRSPADVPAKGKYMNADLRRHAARYDVPFRHNPNFPINTLLLMRGATAVQMHRPASFDAYHRAVFAAMWVDGRNMGDAAVIGAVLAEAGLDPAAVLAMAGQQDVKDRLKAVTAEAVERGVFGAPTMLVGDQLFWGQDRLDFVREALAAPN